MRNKANKANRLINRIIRNLDDIQECSRELDELYGIDVCSAETLCGSKVIQIYRGIDELGIQLNRVAKEDEDGKRKEFTFRHTKIVQVYDPIRKRFMKAFEEV